MDNDERRMPPREDADDASLPLSDFKIISTRPHPENKYGVLRGEPGIALHQNKNFHSLSNTDDDTAGTDLATMDRISLKGAKSRSLSAMVTTFIILFGIWLLLSGIYDFFHMTLGVISCAIVSFFTSDLLFPEFQLKGLPMLWFRFIRYIPWLLKEVLVANIHMMYLVFHPNMMDLIDPHVIRFKSRLKNSYAVVTFANSITLTPGTITINVSIYSNFSIHCIDKKSGDSLPGEMEERVRAVFGE